ncbi:MAG: AMP-binding protein [Ruminococcus sp.]|nr:AMP-binding protein [Ruminococcus sp.]
MSITKENTLTLRDLIYNSAEEFEENTFIRYKVKKNIIDKSYRQFKTDCEAFGSFIKENISNDRLHIAIVGTTAYHYLTGFFGTVISNNIIVPLDSQLSADDICDCVNRADVTVFLYDSRFSALVPKVRELCPQVTDIVQLDGSPIDDSIYSLDSIVKEYNGKSTNVEIDPKSCTAIIYTSGTTGKSKGVMLSHENLMDNCFCNDNESKVGDIILSALPIHHVYCLSCDIILSIKYGAIVCINDNLMHLGKNIATFQPNKMLLVPMIIQTLLFKINALCKENPTIDKQLIARKVLGDNLTIIFSGGAYLSPNIIKGFNELGIKVAQGYGMTECSPRISTGSEFEDNPIDSIGKIVNGCQVRIVDGEIQVKSKSVMMGYYKNPQATKETITEDGWLRTGDLGYKDDNGCLYITGRKKNLIILDNGENVSPEELENKFADNLLVKEVLVYAKDYVITAEIFPNLDYAEANNITDIKSQLQKDIDSINLTLPSAKTIRNLVVRTVEFEKTTSKKIKRSQVGM